MERREALRLLATGAALQLVPGRALAALREARTLLGAQPVLRTLNPHQNATVTAIAEMILPKTETPGATDARVNEFIDLILTEWYDAEERAAFLKGLADVDARARALIGKDFAECAPAQQAEILTGLGERMAEDAQAVAANPRGYRGSLPEPYGNFYFIFRELTLTGYYTSEVGATQELHFRVIPDHYEGCGELGAGKDQTGE